MGTSRSETLAGNFPADTYSIPAVSTSGSGAAQIARSARTTSTGQSATIDGWNNLTLSGRPVRACDNPSLPIAALPPLGLYLLCFISVLLELSQVVHRRCHSK